MKRYAMTGMEDEQNSPNASTTPSKKQSEQSESEIAKEPEALQNQQPSRSESKTHFVQTKLTDDNLAMLNQQTQSETSTKGPSG